MKDLLNAYHRYKEDRLTHRRFKHRDLVQLIRNCGFHNHSAGVSFEGREIRKIVVGTGKRKILLWSQMHGDEATATMALMDVLKFLKASGDEFSGMRENILSGLQLHIVPMLNPDGAERFQRRTAQEIDMNRDALALQCPESRLLKSLVMDLRPEFAFNLHDQSIHYAVGDTPVQSTVAFLATAYDPARKWNKVRTKAMQVICYMNDKLQEIIPGRIARFSDEFESRAFGDNIQKWGSSLILIESGAYPNDPEKQYIRSLNFCALLEALNSIANHNYSHYKRSHYESIPENKRNFVDLKITNIRIADQKGDYRLDLGIVRAEKNLRGAKSFVYTSVIEEMGDLSVYHGIDEYNAEGAILKPLSAFPDLQHLDKNSPQRVIIGESATFVLDHGEKQTLVLNGKIM